MGPGGPKPGEVTHSTITISETSGFSNIHGVSLQASDLIGIGGGLIPHVCLSFDKNNFDVSASSSVNVIVTLTIPSDAEAETYSGTITVNSGNAGSTSLSVTITVEPIPIATTTSISAIPNIVCIDESSLINVEVRDISDNFVPGGDVTLICSIGFFDNGQQTTILPLVSGAASTSWSSSLSGTCFITAIYSDYINGNKKYQSSSNSVVVTINKASSSIYCTVTPDCIALSESTIISGSITPNLGTRIVYLYNSTDGGSTWGFITATDTDTSGSYSYTWTPSIMGSFLIKAVWNGDNNYYGATSPYANLEVVSIKVTYYTDPVSGTITADDIIKHNGDVESCESGDRIHIIANAPIGYSFYEWQVTGGVSVDEKSNYDTYMTVSSTGTLKAVFASSFWKTTTPMKNPVGEHATVIYNGKLYRIGGQNASGNILKTVSFATINKDGTIGNWRSTTPLPEARHFPAGPHVVVYNNRIYVIGGNRPSPSKIETKTVWYHAHKPERNVGELGNRHIFARYLTRAFDRGLEWKNLCDGRLDWWLAPR